jgi:hypothetical protein
MALLGGLLFSINSASAQTTLMYRFPMDAAHSSATGTTNDLSGALTNPIVLQFINSTTAATTTNFYASGGVFPAGFTNVDLRGGPNSGVENVAESLNFTNSVNPGTVPAAMAVAELDPSLASMGDGVTPGSTFSSFTSTVWINMTQPTLGANDTAGPAIWMLGINGANAPGTANTITFRFNSRPGPNGISNTFLMRVGNAAGVSAPIYFPTPTNLWMFFGVVYNSTNQNAYIYYGTEATTAKLMGIKNVGAQTFNFGSTATLSVGNIVNTWSRHFDGKVADLQFYTGAPGGDVANTAFVEAIRQKRTPVLITGTYPDGTSLLQGTNTLAFTASSASGINPTNIFVAVNGVNVSGSLVVSGPSTNRAVSYTGLPVNQPLTGLQNFAPNLNMATINLSVTDSNGITATNFIVYDNYSPTNFTWEAEDYDFNSGQYINNPAYSFTNATNAYFGQTGASGIDYNSSTTAGFYRTADAVGTEKSLSSTADNGNNNSGNMGELMRGKVLAALDLNADGNEDIREVDVNGFASGDSMNYTRTYPSGYFYVYLRAASFNAARSSTLSTVTSGWGTASQTTSVLGTFSISSAGTGGSEDYAWFPLQNNGTNVITPLGGSNTLNLAAGTNGGGEVNFLMLVQQPVPGFTVQPVNEATATGFTATFVSQVFSISNITYQWQRENPGATNFGSLTGATNASYTTPVLSLAADNQAQYRVLATSDGTTITSAVVVLTVSLPTPPVLLGALDDFTGITVRFNQPLDPVTGSNTLNYILSGGASVTGVSFLPGGSNVLLSASGLTLGSNYTLTVTNVQNLYSNAIAANSTASFGAYTFFDNFDGGLFPALPAYATLYGVGAIVPSGGSNNSGGLELMAAAQSQSGSAVFPDALNGGTLTNFEAAFDLQLANPSVPPDGGFSFNLANNVANGTFGGGGSGTGLSLIIVLNADDTRANTAPPCISVIYNGAVAVSSVDGSYLTQPINPATFIDGKFDEVIFKVAADGTLTLVVNNVEYFGGEVIQGWAGTGLTAPKLGIGGNNGNNGNLYTQMTIDNLEVAYNGTLPLPLPPTILITSPGNGSTYATNATVPITVNAVDPQGHITSVAYFVNGVQVFTTTNAPYSFSLTNAGNSVYNIVAKVTDALNLTSTSETLQIIAGTPPQILYVYGFGALNASDTALISYLSNLGYNVVQVADANTTPQSANGSVLVITSGSAVALNIGYNFYDVAVPMLNWLSGVEGYDLFTIDDATDHNDAASETQITITNPKSTLAAGLSGTVAVQTTANTMPWGIPATNAIKVALIPGTTNEYCLYAYEKGSLLIDGATPAAARYVETFLAPNDYTTLTASGLKLINASIAWLLATPAPVISFSTTGNTLNLTYTVGGTLQSSTNLLGPWSNVSTSGSFSTNMNQNALFFRVQ